jgi:Ca2+:H+ antiporter
MLLLAAAALVLPAVFQLIHGGSLPNVSELSHNYGSDVEKLSLLVAIILILSYVAGLWFSLRTHRDLFNVETEDDDEVDSNTWTIRKSVILLAIAGVLVGIMSEILVGSIEEASHKVGLSQFFVGVFVVAIVGNAAEHYVAVVVARKNKMDLSVNIAIGSSAQIALFVAPVLVILSFFVGPYPMALVFNGYEVAGLIAAVLVANFLASEGESTWFEGVQLLALYLVLGLVFLLA